MSVNELFDPARLPERDCAGQLIHPDMSIVTMGMDEDHNLSQSILARWGWTGAQRWAEDDPEYGAGIDDDDEVAKLMAWNPTPPDGYRTAWLIHAEEGPVALFVRPKVTA